MGFSLLNSTVFFPPRPASIASCCSPLAQPAASILKIRVCECEKTVIVTVLTTGLAKYTNLLNTDGNKAVIAARISKDQCTKHSPLSFFFQSTEAFSG